MKSKFLKILTLIILLGIAVIVGLSLINYGDGVRAGTVLKLNKRGYVFKTYEGEMNLGMVINEGVASSGIPQLWTFTLKDDPELIQKVTDAMLSGKRVGLKYKQKYLVWPWVGNSKNIVYDIESEPMGK